jgi:ubiquinone/menaquinone biosynthesis C-methylase UbiE
MPLHDTDRDYEIVDVADGYDRWSEIYDQPGNALLPLEEPVVDSLLGELRGVKLLDLGTGTGRHAIRLASRGAEVTGVDFSEGMLEKARAKPGADLVRFVQHDFSSPLPFDDGAFDHIVCALALEHVADLPAAYAEMRRVCSGSLVVSCMHPAMMLRGVIAHFTDPVSGREVQPRATAYEIADYVNAAIAAGWQLERLEERSVGEALVADVPRMQRYVGWPLLFAMRLR